MKRLRAPLLKAARDASPARFLHVIRRFADVPGIAAYSLGHYRPGLPRRLKGAYHRGTGRFMSRYFAKQTRKYRIVKAEFSPTSWREGNIYYVDSEVHLQGGSTYSVRWKLVRIRRGFKIKDVRVMGFWLTWFQKNLFESFISSRGGSVNALVIALNLYR